MLVSFDMEPASAPDENTTLIATPAATMVIFRDNPSGGAPLLLMVERVKAMACAGGAAVFPGGKVDAADFDYAAMLKGPLELDEAAARLAAIRETIEEAGLALGCRGFQTQPIVTKRAQLCMMVIACKLSVHGMDGRPI